MDKKYIALVVFFIVLVVLIVFRNQISAALTKSSTQPGKEPQTNPSTPAAVVLDYNKLLRKGMTAAEVKRLQQWLGITADGVFGNQTESALYNKKGVKEITLNEYINIYPDLTGAGSDPADTYGNSDDIINWSTTDPNAGFLDQVSSYLFNWLS